MMRQEQQAKHTDSHTTDTPSARTKPATASKKTTILPDGRFDRNMEQLRTLHRATPESFHAVPEATVSVITETKELEEYFRLRAEIFRDDLDCDEFPKEPDDYDNISEHIILKINNQVTGGLRLTVHTEENMDTPLWFEHNQYHLKEEFPILQNSHYRVGSFSKYFVKKELRNGLYGSMLFAAADRQMVQAHNLDYVLSSVPYSHAIYYRRKIRKFGHDIDIFEHDPRLRNPVLGDATPNLMIIYTKPHLPQLVASTPLRLSTRHPSDSIKSA